METLQRTANRGSISTGYDIDNSLKLEEANLECINTPSSYSLITASNVYKGTTSFWIKRTSLNNGSGVQWLFNGSNSSRYDGIYWDANDKLKGYFSALGNGADFVTTQVFRDTSAWYHIVMAIETSLSTASERIKIYVNGEQITDWDTSPSIDQNTQLTSLGTDAYHGWGTSYSYNLGVSSDGSSEYLANCIHIDGQQLTSTDFGEFDEDSGIWKPKAYTGTYGNKGYLLEFQSSSALGTDTSGNGNNFTNNRNITSANQATDTPTNNFCTLNPLWTFANTMGVSDGGTKVNNTVTAWGGAKGSIGVNSGKWYWEHLAFSGNDTMFGIQNQAGGGNTQAYLDPYTLALQANSNVIQFTDPSNRTEAFSKTFSVSDIWGVALDLDANTIAYYRNGSIVNSAFSIDGLIGNGEFFPFVTHYGSGLNSRVNFGGFVPAYLISSAASDENDYGTFEYAPPSGYYALCTKNLAEYG